MNHSCGKDRRELVLFLSLLGALAVLMAYALHEYFTPCPPPEIEMIVCPCERELAYRICETKRVASLIALTFTVLLAIMWVALYIAVLIEEKHSCGGAHGGG